MEADQERAQDFDVVVEDSSSHGRLDMAVVYKDKGVYLFEFKVVESQAHGLALEQLRERDYAAKYRGQQEAIYLIGVEFGKETRNVVAFDVQPAQEAPVA